MANDRVTIDLVFTCESIEFLKKAADIVKELATKYPDEPRFSDLCECILSAIAESSAGEEN